MAAIDGPFVRRWRQRAADRVLLRGEPRERVGVGRAALERDRRARLARFRHRFGVEQIAFDAIVAPRRIDRRDRSEEHTSELQSLMRISYAVFCLKKKKKNPNKTK